MFCEDWLPVVCLHLLLALPCVDHGDGVFFVDEPSLHYGSPDASALSDSSWHDLFPA